MTYDTVYGVVPWNQCPVSILPNASFCQTSPVGTKSVPQNMTAVMTFTAVSAGVASFEWLTSGGDRLDFFYLVSASGANVTIVPEPTTAILMLVGLTGLAVSSRRR
jgi:hypothetical protein